MSHRYGIGNPFSMTLEVVLFYQSRKIQTLGLDSGEGNKLGLPFASAGFKKTKSSVWRSPAVPSSPLVFETKPPANNQVSLCLILSLLCMSPRERGEMTRQSLGILASLGHTLT